MSNDKLLIWKFKHGSKNALQRIYEKYEGYLLNIAGNLLIDVSDAEDVLHDVFVTFAQSEERIKLNGNLKGYLTRCVINRSRDRLRKKQRQHMVSLHEVEPICSEATQPDISAIGNEEFNQIRCYFNQLPYEQREVITLRLHGGMRFRQIARLQEVSVNTVQGRYRYGLSKLRSLLDSKVTR